MMSKSKSWTNSASIWAAQKTKKQADLDAEIEIRQHKMTTAFHMDKRKIYYRRSIPKKARLRFFLAKITAIAVYGCQVWNLRARHLQALHKTYKHLLKQVTGLRSYNIAWEHLIKYGIQHSCKIVPLHLRI